jgi:hypothetical protein
MYFLQGQYRIYNKRTVPVSNVKDRLQKTQSLNGNPDHVLEMLAMLSVRTFSEEFNTRTFTQQTLTKNDTTNFHTGASYFLAESVLHIAAITLLKVMLVTTVVNKNSQPSIIAKSALVHVSNSITTCDPRFEITDRTYPQQ